MKTSKKEKIGNEIATTMNKKIKQLSVDHNKSFAKNIKSQLNLSTNLKNMDAQKCFVDFICMVTLVTGQDYSYLYQRQFLGLQYFMETIQIKMCRNYSQYSAPNHSIGDDIQVAGKSLYNH